jgi:glycosyltransferase involved in cell wall biosynthesis
MQKGPAGKGMKKVSVIVTTYNSAGYIEKSIRSILDQKGSGTLFEMEVIAIDDHSSDNTVEILQRFPIRVITSVTNSGGPNRGRNIGLKLAQGDYICHSDHDDLWHPERISTLLPYLQSAPIVTSGFEVENVNQNDPPRIIRMKSDTPWKLFQKNETFLKKLTKSLDAQNTYLSSHYLQKSAERYSIRRAFWTGGLRLDPPVISPANLH